MQMQAVQGGADGVAPPAPTPGAEMDDRVAGGGGGGGGAASAREPHTQLPYGYLYPLSSLKIETEEGKHENMWAYQWGNIYQLNDRHRFRLFFSDNGHGKRALRTIFLCARRLQNVQSAAATAVALTSPVVLI